MNLILFHQASDSNKKSSEEPNSLPTPSNYQVLFSGTCVFPAKMRRTKKKKKNGMESHCHPKNSLETWLSFLLFVRLGVLSYLLNLDQKKSGTKATRSSRKTSHRETNRNGTHSQLDHILCLTRAFVTGTHGLLAQFAVLPSHIWQESLQLYILLILLGSHNKLLFR